MCSGLAYYLAMKKSPDKIQTLRLVYEDELQRALMKMVKELLYIFHHKVLWRWSCIMAKSNRKKIISNIR